MDKEKYIFQVPKDFEQIVIRLSSDAFDWLNGTTTTADGTIISHTVLFYDILSRMQFKDNVDESFRRPQQVLAGQGQLSEVMLADQWQMGRKQVHNIIEKMVKLELLTMERSKIASVASYTCILGWSTDGSPMIANTFYEAVQSL